MIYTTLRAVMICQVCDLDKKRLQFCIKIAVFFGADDRARTGTGFWSHRILSPRRLPIPPHRHAWGHSLLYHSFGESQVEAVTFDETEKVRK